MKFLKKTKLLLKHIIAVIDIPNYPNVSNSAHIGYPSEILNKDNIVMEEHSGFGGDALIMNTRAKFIMKKYSGAAKGLSVITGNHMSIPGKFYMQVTDADKDALDLIHEYDKDVIVEEEVWIGTNVTLLSGVVVGRGAVVGAGSVVRKNIPPYAIVAGNPAQVVGFRFTPNIAIQHEELLYPESQRLTIDLLESNYNKYFVKRISQIREFLG